MNINENFYAYLAQEVGDNKSIIEHFTMLLEKLYDENWSALVEEDMKDYDFASDIESLSEENDAYYYAYYNFIDVLRSELHTNDVSYKLNEFASGYWFQRRVSNIEDILLKCTELRDLFHPTEDYPTYEDVVSSSIDWAIDNWQEEARNLGIPEWTFENSVIIEVVGFKMPIIVGDDKEALGKLDELHNKLLQ